MEMNLVHFNKARNELVLATNIDEVKEIRDKAEALRMYAKQAGESLEMQNQCAEIKIRAERRAGEIIPEQAKHEGGRPVKNRSHDVTSFKEPPKLSDLGITKSQSSRWQEIASIPEETFEAYIVETKGKKKELTSSGLYKVAKKKKKEESKQEKNRIIEVVSGIDGKLHKTTKKNPKEGEWWNLGRHRLYCGDTSQDPFTSQLSKCAFAFADPPYNAKAAKWDNNFNWSHDYLSEYAEVVAVTPGIVSIKDFMMVTNMPYVWSIAGVITNGMTRGAVGFGNWIYTALFSDKSVYRNSQDVISCAIKTSETQETSHKGRKPFEFLGLLFDKFTEENDTIIDPFLGSGQTLLACEKMDLACIGGEISTSFCADIIERWESVSHIEAVRNDPIQ